jgi:hypothetical protein
MNYEWTIGFGWVECNTFLFRFSLECLRATKLNFEEKLSKEKDNLILILHQNEIVATREELIKELKVELKRL